MASLYSLSSCWRGRPAVLRGVRGRVTDGVVSDGDVLAVRLMPRPLLRAISGMVAPSASGLGSA